MSREALLAGGAAAVLAAVVLAAIAVPGILAEPSDDVRQSRLAIQETTIGTGHVGGETATLSVTTHLRHGGGPAGNVTVVYRAIDADTGLVATTVERDVGTVSGGGERTVTGNVSVDRQGDYRVDTLLYQDSRRVETTRTTVRGVGSLEPAYAGSPVQFHRFDRLADLPAVQYSVADAAGNRTTLDVSTLLTNAGDEPAGDLRVVVAARQADSNIVADRGEIRVGTIDPGATVDPSTTLTVPDGYNYYLDAVLYRDGVIVGTAQSAANLDPTETISANETRRDIGLEVGDFERDRDESTPVPEAMTPTPAPDGASGPGFGIGVAVLAVGLAALLARRWSA